MKAWQSIIIWGAIALVGYELFQSFSATATSTPTTVAGALQQAGVPLSPVTATTENNLLSALSSGAASGLVNEAFGSV